MAAIDDTIEERENWHWRNTMRPVRFFNLDARAAIPFCFLLVYMRLQTLIFAIVVTVIFRALESKGLTFPAAIRSIRVWLVGRARPGWSSVHHRRMKDYG